MARGELVTNLGNPVLAHSHFRERVALAIPVLEDLIHPARLIVAHRPGNVTESLGPCRNHHPCRDTQRDVFANQNVIRIHIRILRHKACLVQLGIVRILHLLRHGRIRLDKALLLT